MLIIPLPPLLLDLFITLNISVALAIVVTTLYVPRALDFSAFPSLLLLTTLFRLAINVSVTRLILLHGDAGHVVKAFGEFVVGGNVVVGLVVFLILIVIQFVVVTNGAGRVAEVGARFTLDAMPGKQMAIDADLNAGQITEDEARRRRDEIAREADFYGAMDGASKFVKGDAMAAMIITAINLIGGIVIGVMQQGMPIGEAVQHFSLLTIGDGLAAQIPALLISVAAGIIVTRAASESDLGTDVAGQIIDSSARPRWSPASSSARSRSSRACRRCPSSSSAACSSSSAARWQDRRAGGRRPGDRRRAAGRAARARSTPRDQAREALQIDPLELAHRLRPGPAGRRRRPAARCCSRVSAVRRQIAGELGTVIPSVRIHDEVGLSVARVRRSRCAARVVARGKVLAGHQLALDPGDAVGQLAGIPTTEPAFGLPAVWIADARARRGRGARLHGGRRRVGHRHPPHRDDPPPRRRPAHPPGRARLLDGLKEINAAVVEEVVPDLLSVGELQRVLQALLREGVSIRDLGAIVEAVGDRARVTRDPALLAEYARQALGRTIVAPYLDEERTLRAITLDPRARAGGLRRDRRRRPTASTSRWTRSAPRASCSGLSEQSEQVARPRPPAGAAVLLARAASPAPPLRAGAAAALGLRVQRDPAGRRRGDHGRRRRRPCPPTHAGRRVADRSEVPVVARAMTRLAVRSSWCLRGLRDRVAV